MTRLLEVERLVRSYPQPRRRLFAGARRLRVLHEVSLSIAAGESFGLVGESGSGKSTLARSVLALEAPDSGHVRLMGEDLFALPARRLRALRRHMQMVFQDPYGSLDPRQPIARIVAEPLTTLAEAAGRGERRDAVERALAAVGLPGSAMDRYPHEFSGGQRQRIAIARALITRPDLIVADEPVSALDVSVQAQVLNLLMDLQAQKGLAFLMISHDLAVVRHVTARVAVLYLGRIVEEGPTEAVFSRPAHPYTRALLAAVPRLRPGARHTTQVRGEVQSADTPRGDIGCPFAPRCPLAEARCRRELPDLREIVPGQRAACLLL